MKSKITVQNQDQNGKFSIGEYISLNNRYAVNVIIFEGPLHDREDFWKTFYKGNSNFCKEVLLRKFLREAFFRKFFPREFIYN